MKTLLLLALTGLTSCALFEGKPKPAKQPDVWTSTQQLDRSRKRTGSDLEQLNRALDEANLYLNKAEYEEEQKK